MYVYVCMHICMCVCMYIDIDTYVSLCTLRSTCYV